ncbi:4a-hydroxytetrahydrobiopterin dehydratase [Rhizobium sp. CFBP 8762]|uniref:4a-hydroxytetrahydrobiopterin dehydratase n=1 Tax=Rhizobium sp. CFBP 8762 TaxID=2775279 RepID=UPI0017816D5C|nr:4a-hydroxytetrahydrobiopterin dehydratase [Rhizobium sp. CFBP 8762]MBD8555460.1 4a-hydroxytetrahydrobiopterin dehydratase [Rhizobium sp. CFBP 8762]
MKQQKLDRQEIFNRLQTLDSWALDAEESGITRTFRFTTFARAFTFMTECAFAAETLNHHPEWFNVYSRVDVRLTTHDAGGLSALDFKLAAIMDKAARV